MRRERSKDDIAALVEARLEAIFQFKAKQWQKNAIIAVLSGTDVIVSAGTGSGKSLAFQGAAALLEKGEVAIVVSPLNALMEDQVFLIFFLDILLTSVRSNHFK
jgi:superfamily II DNA helicase RecQ